MVIIAFTLLSCLFMVAFEVSRASASKKLKRTEIVAVKL